MSPVSGQTAKNATVKAERLPQACAVNGWRDQNFPIQSSGAQTDCPLTNSNSSVRVMTSRLGITEDQTAPKAVELDCGICMYTHACLKRSSRNCVGLGRDGRV